MCMLCVLCVRKEKSEGGQHGKRLCPNPPLPRWPRFLHDDITFCLPIEATGGLDVTKRLQRVCTYGKLQLALGNRPLVGLLPHCGSGVDRRIPDGGVDETTNGITMI